MENLKKEREREIKKEKQVFIYKNKFIAIIFFIFLDIFCFNETSRGLSLSLDFAPHFFITIKF